LRLRLYNLVGCLVQILYNGVLGVWPLVTLTVVLAAIQVANLRRLPRGRDDPTSYAVAEVPADGPLVAHLLGEHRQDVVRFQPGFERPSRDAEAYLVLSGDEVIGCVVVHDAGDGGCPYRFVKRLPACVSRRGCRCGAWRAGRRCGVAR